MEVAISLSRESLSSLSTIATIPGSLAHLFEANARNLRSQKGYLPFNVRELSFAEARAVLWVAGKTIYVLTLVGK
jgi:hypothetical protein